MPVTKRNTNIIRFTARALAIVFAGFLLLLSMDAFNGTSTVFEKLKSLGVHLLPTILVIGVLILSLKKEIAGGILFILLGAVYIFSQDGLAPVSWYFIIAAPLFVIGLLFIATGLRHKKHVDANSANQDIA